MARIMPRPYSSAKQFMDRLMVSWRMRGKSDGYLPLPSNDHRRPTGSTTSRGRGRTRQALQIPNIDTNCIRVDKRRWILWKLMGFFGMCAFIWACRAIQGSLTDPYGNIPSFGEYPGCPDTTFLYNDTLSFATGVNNSLSQDHQFNIHGYGASAITVTDSEAGVHDIVYKIRVRTNRKRFLDGITFSHPTTKDGGLGTAKTRFVIESPRPSRLRGRNFCLKYDIIISVPPGLKTLRIVPHTDSHIQFAPGTQLKIDKLYVYANGMSKNNMILVNKDIHVRKLSLDVYRGWIVGEVPIVEETSISTQRSDGLANVKIFPVPAVPKRAILQTTTGAGRSDFTYVGDDKMPKRQIEAVHLSSRNGDLHLNYREAKFNGKVQLQSSAHTVIGATSLSVSTEDTEWTHFFGSQDGGDEIHVNSGGWTGLYF